MAAPPFPAPAAPTAPVPMPPDMAAAPMEEEIVEESPEVVVTVLRTTDGAYMVVEGDEPEPGAEETMGAGAEPVPVAPAGQVFDSVGAALKAVMDILEADSRTPGEETGEAAFEAGYAEGEDEEMMAA